MYKSYICTRRTWSGHDTRQELYMDWAGRWEKMDEATKYKERQRISLQGKLRNCAHHIKSVGNGEYNVDLGNDVVVPGVSKIRASEMMLEHKYGIKIKIEKMQPFTFEVLTDSQPILANERGTVNPYLSISEGEIMLQELERAAQYCDDPLLQSSIAKLSKSLQYAKQRSLKSE